MSATNAVVLGASGQIGRLVVERAASLGILVRAVWRRPPEIEIPPGVEVVVESEPTSAAALRRLLRGTDVIVTAVGLRRKHPRNPWSRLLSPRDLCARFATNLVAATQSSRLSPPLVAISAAGVGDSEPAMSLWLRQLFKWSNIGVAYRDLHNMESTLRDYGGPVRCVRPTTLSNKSNTSYRQVARYGFWTGISRVAVATFIVDQLIAATWSGFGTPMIASGRHKSDLLMSGAQS